MLTTQQLAAHLGIPARTLLDRAAVRGIKPAFDTPRLKLWKPAQAVKLAAAGKRGRPKAVH